MNSEKKVHVKIKIVLTYAISIAIGCLLFYLIIPHLLNYGSDTINTSFDKQVSGGFYYYQQVLFVAIGLILVVSSILFFLLKDIDYYPLYKLNATKYKKNLEYIKNLCLGLPNKILSIFIIVPLILAFSVLFMQTSYITSADFKLVLVIFI